jgi:uncharacterized membrane protein YfcA
MSLDYWYLLPVGVVIAALAMSSGVSAGNFWVPVYLLWAKFEPPLAFWLTLTTMLCGYGSGVVRNLWQETLDRRTTVHYLRFTLPAALIGGYVAPALDVSWLVLLFGLFVLGYGGWMVVSLLKSPVAAAHGQGQVWSSPHRRESSTSPLASNRNGRASARPFQEKARPRDSAIALLGGTLLGLIAVGLGELLLPRLLATRKTLPSANLVGSTVLVIFVTSLAAALVRLNGSFLGVLGVQRTTLLGALMYAGPGVILGGQLGPMMARWLPVVALRWYVAVLLMLVGILMLVRFTAVPVLSR